MSQQIITGLAGFAAGLLTYGVLAQWLPPRSLREFARRKLGKGRWPS